MMLFRMFFRSIRDSFKSVFRNFSLSLASISCITITLVIVAISLIASLNVNNIAKNIKEDVTIIVYVKRDAKKEVTAQISEKIKIIDNVAHISFKSKEQIKNEIGSTSDKLNSIMNNWTEETNPLKDTYQVTVKDIVEIKNTADTIKKIAGVEVVDYGEVMVTKLISLFNVVEKVSVVSVIALIIVNIFLIMNTIKLTIFSRKREISIMRLVGASNFTIKTPFVIEGMVLGLLGSIIPVMLVIYGYFGVYKHLGGYIYSPLLKMVSPEPFIYIVSLIVVVIGIIVGMIGSYRAVRRYLKV